MINNSDRRTFAAFSYADKLNSTAVKAHKGITAS
jgi:hypothetical protein